MVETVVAAGTAGKCRHAARPGESEPRERRTPALRASRRALGDASVAQSLFCCAPAKRIRISRLEHVFDL